MYEKHFGFLHRPFALTPDPAFLYASRQHRMALTMLEYGLASQAPLLLLTGDVGSGKTTLVRRLIRDLAGALQVGLISNSHTGTRSIMRWALSALEIAPADDSEIAAYEALVHTFVDTYARGRRTLLIVDEAQNLREDVLEELRLLSNVNSETDVVLQILLVGQPELRATLAKPELRQVAQRVSADFHLGPLSRDDVAGYIRHRLMVAGGREGIFSAAAIDEIFAATNGVPRLVNQLCDFCLVYGFADEKTSIDTAVVRQVIEDRNRHGSLSLFVGTSVGAIPQAAVSAGGASSLPVQASGEGRSGL